MPYHTEEREPPSVRALVLSGGGGRGAYELGVYRACVERQRRFDVISGTSVGAITACAIATGMSVSELEALWARMHAFRVMQPRGDVWAFPKWTHLMYTRPLRQFLERELDFDAIRGSATEVRIAAVDVGTGDLRVFHNDEITPARLMASAAIPILFPMVEDDGRHYWDGGTIVNTPLRPAIDAGATEITCVLLSPVGARELPPPRNLWEAISRVADLRLLGHLKEDIKHAELINGLIARGKSLDGWRHIDFHIVSPHETLGLTTILNFDAKLAARLIAWGHRDGLAHIDAHRDAPPQEHPIETRARAELHESAAREGVYVWEEIPGTDF